ncbi:MAG TPA: MGMT family protein [Burkholderiales bacterium]|nr:MGMT family protein [Burkholderiales bacterium]
MTKQVNVDSSYTHIYAIVKKVPKGKVATYGQIAALAGIPRHARQVGYALHALSDGADIPWHRVINAKGEVSPRTWSENHLLQRILLEAEGVEFDTNGRVSLTRFGWKTSR